MKLSEKKFIEAGYKRYNQDCLKNCDYLLQKKVTDEEGVKYFINIYVYIWKDEPWYREGIESGFTGSGETFDKEITFQPEVQFGSAMYDAMNVTLLVDDITDVQEIEYTFENLWVSLGKPYYEKYHEGDIKKEKYHIDDIDQEFYQE